MSVLGVGVDMVEVSRIEHSLEKFFSSKIIPASAMRTKMHDFKPNSTAYPAR